ncbi:MAG: redoxin domain-containing protein [Alphaproteobacteria bacterium]|nr:redoxin domain-containing protein [Alphaproteobacteria bacterium]
MAPTGATRPVVPDYVENFRLVDHKGASHELYYHAEAPAVVLMTQGNGCPIVRAAMPEFQRLREKFAAAGVPFYLINSNLQDSRDEVAEESAEYGYATPILMDDHQIIGESLGVERTAEVFVLDPAQGFKVAYHGPLNDRLTYERQKAEADNHYVEDVLAAMVAGEPVTTKAPALTPGCLVNFPQRDRRQQHANISYTADIAPILKGKCVECHQEGGIGPWAMTDYETIQGWAPMMRQVIRTDRMPPWHADPEVGQFKHDRSLSSEQIKTLVHWIEAGAPRGDGPDPLAALDLKAPEWPLGEPDLVLKLPKQTVPATGIVDYTYPVIENPLTEDKWLKATTVKVGSRETVHHLLSGYMPEVPEDGKGYNDRWIASTGGYAVGAESNVQPDGSGSPFPAGGAIGFQMHYTPYGKEVVDETEIGFYFHDETPELMNRNAVVIDVSIVIPPNEGRHQETAYIEFPADAVLVDIFPHAHYRGYSANARLRYPNGEEKLLISLPRYDFNWQRAYEFDEPVEVPAGSKLIADYIYDNSAANPANPDPDATVLWGEQSHEEMLFTAFNYRWKEETTSDRKDHYSALLRAGQHFGAMDDNIDGILTKAELRGVLGEQIGKSFDAMDRDGDGALTLKEFRGAQMARERRADAGEAAADRGGDDGSSGGDR